MMVTDLSVLLMDIISMDNVHYFSEDSCISHVGGIQRAIFSLKIIYLADLLVLNYDKCGTFLIIKNGSIGDVKFILSPLPSVGASKLLPFKFNLLSSLIFAT